MKIAFKGKAHFMEYHGAVNFVDGETKDVPDGAGEYLLAVFGDFFTEVKPTPTPKTREMAAPPKDKMIRKAKTKTATKKR